MSWLDRLERAMSVYDVDPQDEAHAYFTSQDPKVLEGMFEAVQEEVARDDCFPLLVQRKDDYAFFILRNEPRAIRPAWIPWALFLATVVTTVLAGAVFLQGYSRGTEDLFSFPLLLGGALLFALPLLAILGAHEAARRYAARRAGVELTPPWFIPLPPPLSFLGTLGAISDVRAPVATRHRLAFVGGLGPLAGFVASLAVLAAGLALSNVADLPAQRGEDAVRVGVPLAMQLLEGVVGPGDTVLHPLALAGWVGLFLTGLHLLPAAGLEGGMVARALLGRHARWLALATILALAALGIVYWWPWLVVALGLVLAGIVHPQPLNEVTPPGPAAWTVGVLCAIALALSFAVLPLG